MPEGELNMGYIVNGKEYSYDSSVNQSILDKLVSREVLCCMTQEVEYILSKNYDAVEDDAPFGHEDIEHEDTKTCRECDRDDNFTEFFVDELPDDHFTTIGCEEDEDLEYECPVCQLSYKMLDDAKGCCPNEKVYVCDGCKTVYCESDYEDLDSVDNEIYEWWAVSRWFGERLKSQGEHVIESYCKSYWGRMTTGQSISLDGIIKRVAYSLEILEGQKYSWAPNEVA